MHTQTLGVLLLVAGLFIFFGGNTLLGRKYKRYESTPENPAIGSRDPQIDSREGLNLAGYFLLRSLWILVSMGLIFAGLFVFVT